MYMRIHPKLLRDVAGQTGRGQAIRGIWDGIALIAVHGLHNLRIRQVRSRWEAEAVFKHSELLALLGCPRDRLRPAGYGDYRREHQRAVRNALDNLAATDVDIELGNGSTNLYSGPLLEIDGDLLRICCYAAPHYYVNVSQRMLLLRERMNLDAMRALFWLLWRHRGSKYSGPIWDCSVGRKQFTQWFGSDGRQADHRGIRAITTLQELGVLSVCSIRNRSISFTLSPRFFT